MGFLELNGVAKRYGSVSVLEGFDLSVKEGEFLVLVGPSGCGKSTALRLIAGLDTPSEGEIKIQGRSVLGVEPKDRDIAMVFQSYALYPHMNVFDNMAFGLRMGRKLGETEVKKRVEEAAELLQLGKFLQRKPKELSGGQRQRVAVGRALVRKPKIFLFDEPLSNLDAHLRNQMRVEIRKLQQKLGVTSIYVTHDQVEATTMGDRIAVLQGGRLQQVDSPTAVYRKPANAFVAGFIGMPEMNFLEAKELGAGAAGAARIGVRPESVELGSGDQKAKVELVENLGAHALVHMKLASGTPLRALVANHLQPKQEEMVSYRFKELHYFAENGNRMEQGV